MPKVLFLIDTLEVGGAETSILEIASRLKKWKPVVISIYKGDALIERFREKEIKVYTLDSEKKFNISEGLTSIGEIIREEKPDVIHATLFRAEQFSRILGPKYKIPVINSFVNDSYSQERYRNLDFLGGIKLKVYQFFDRITASRVDKFMSITKAIIPNNANALKINPKNIDVIYRGRDISSFRKKGSIQLEQLGNLNNGPVILTVSRLLKRKGYIESIKAMAKVINIRPDVKYLIAGEGHDRPVFEKLIARLELEKNVQLLGNRSDVPGLLQRADIFLFPSHYEGQGGALVEAMIMGTPIIAARIPVIEESVEDLKSALLFEPKDVEDLSNKILWALENSKNMRQIGENAKSVAEERFDIEVVASEHEKLYNKVLKEQSTEV